MRRNGRDAPIAAIPRVGVNDDRALAEQRSGLAFGTGGTTKWKPVQRGSAMASEALIKVLVPAYRCRFFDGVCGSMKWAGQPA